MGIKKNIFNNGIANTSQKIVRALEQLLLVPFFITSWGATYYGEWITLTIIPSVLALSDLGFGSATANSFVLKYASGDKKGAADIFKTGFVIISFAVLMGVVLSVVCLFMGISFGWFAKTLIPAQDIVIALSFMMIARLLGFYSQLFGANFIAARRAALGVNIGSLNGLLNIVAGLTVLLSGGNIVEYALGQFIVSVLFNIVYWQCAVKILGLNREHKGKYNRMYAREIVSKGFGYLASPIWQSLLLQGTTVIVRTTLGPVAVAVFNTVRTLSNAVHQLYSLVNGSIKPEMQYELGANNILKAQKIFIYAMRFTFVFSLAGVIFLVFFGLPLYNWWTHNELTPPLMMWYLFLIIILLRALWWTAGTVFSAVNKPYPLAVSGITASIISLIMSYYCCKLWGLTGVALGCLFFEIIMSLYILPTSCKLMKIKILDIFYYYKIKYK
jgi:O-antigen/teichoic acid export membrane protein